MCLLKRFQLPIDNRLAVAILVQVSVLLLLWANFLLLPTLAKPQAKVFEQIWQTVNDNFFSPDFNGVDWEAMRQKYLPKAKQAQSNQDLAIVINQMLSQLKTSHTQFYTQAEPAYYQLAGIFWQSLQEELKGFLPNGSPEYTGIGLYTREIKGKTFISAILNGSPAERAGLKVGDQLLGVEGSSYQSIQSFVDKAGKKVKVRIQRTPNPNGLQEIVVVPQKLDPRKMFLEAMKASVEMIEREKKKIGYIHVWSYADPVYQKQLELELVSGRLKDADGLIWDLRDGWGGASPTYLNLFTAPLPTLTAVGRDGVKKTTDLQWKKPVVMLVNQETRSGKEILAYSFQKYDVGQIVGSQTAGAVVQGLAFIMKDGSLLYVAVADIFVDGKRLEGKGVKPDLEVRYPLEYAQGADPQKEKALETVLKVLSN